MLYRREDETGWKTVKRALTDQLFAWDTTSVPDGTYIVRIVASDAPSNPQALALAGEADSVAFDVDNASPAIRVTAVRRAGGRTVVSFEAADAQSAILRVDYSIESGPWRPASPTDGICDSRLERFEISVDGSAPSVVIRAMDAMNNLTTTRAEAPGKL